MEKPIIRRSSNNIKQGQVFKSKQVKKNAIFFTLTCARTERRGNLTCAHLDYDSCMYSALEERMLREYGCVAPYIMPSNNSSSNSGGSHGGGVCKHPEDVRGAYDIAPTRVTNQVCVKSEQGFSTYLYL